MRGLFVALCLAIFGCSGPSAAEPEETGAEPTAAYYSVADFKALGLSAEALDGGRTLVCGPEDSSGCICLEPLPCEAEGDCISFDDNVEAFRSALAQGQNDRTVQCDHAETGRCGAFQYFYFRGDLERREMRWFDESGLLVGQRNVTDYRAYCNGATRARFQGRLPKCEDMASRELLCGEARNPLPAPLDDLRRFTATPLEPGP